LNGGSLWTGVLTDITGQQLAAEASRRTAELLRQAEAIAKVGGWEIDLEAGTLYWSEEVFRIHGLEPAEYTPTVASSVQFYAPEWRPVITQAVQRVIETGEDFDLDLELLTATGQRLWVHATSQAVLREGRVVRIRGAFRDISQERRATAVLANNHAVLAGILESAEGPIFSVDRAYRYTSFNKAHAAVMQALYGREVTLGSSILEHQTVQADRDIAKANLERALAGEAFTEEAMSGEEHLSRHFFEVTHTPIYDIAEGKVTGVAVFARNVTQRHRTESALHRVTDLLSQVGHIAGVGGWEMDLEEQSLYWTDQTYTIHDLEPGAYTPTLETAIQFYSPEWRPVITAAVQTAIETGKAFDLELELITARNRRIWVRTYAQVISREGRVVKVLGAFQDITERKQSEEALRESNRRLQLATDSADMAVWDWDLQTGTMTWDDRMFELYGMTRLETQGTGQDWIEALHPEDLERAMTESKAALMGNAPYATEFRIRHRDGTILWIKANATVLRNTAGEPVRMVGVNQDITKEKKLEAEIRNLNRGLERRVEQRTHQLEVAKGELEAFAYSVSHDLRAPLRAISGFAEALSLDADSHLSADGLQHLQRIRDGSLRMANLIEDLLRLSRIGRDDCTLIPMDLADLAEQVLAGLRSAQPERLVDCRIQRPIPVQGDPRLLRVLLENLLGNAWKFTARVPSVRIELSARPLDDAMLEISLRDNGAGFPASQTAKLFAPFQRLHKESDYPGSGIGLAIAKRIVTRHGGFIRAEGEPGLGAAFHFSLPTVKEEPS
jgi:PAS domain S-box-containing protein